jgi:hypothetical protein
MTAKAETYRAIAEGCRVRAVRAVSRKDQLEWLGLADSWLRLTEDAESESEALREQGTARLAPSEKNSQARH